MIVKKRTYRIADFAIPADHRVKSEESEKIDNYLDLAREQQSDDNTNCNWYTWYNHQRIGKGTRGTGNQIPRGDHPKYSPVKIGQNTEKSLGDLLSLKLQWKTIS